jgi:hypothetical protein
MDILALILSVIALGMATFALKRTGGIQDIRNQVDALGTDVKRQLGTLGTKTEAVGGAMREKTAEALGRLEQLVRGKDSANRPPESSGSHQEHHPGEPVQGEQTNRESHP